MVEPTIEAAPAKINLALHVTGRRETGYHDLESLVVFAELGDELHAKSARSDSLEISGPFASALTNGQSNLVLKAVAAFRERWPSAVHGGLSLHLAKNLPVAAGIGGGSADAAAALRLMSRISGLRIDPGELRELAAGLGADVPVCLLSQPCLVRGIGEVIRPLRAFPPCHVVLVNPLVPLATAEIFKRLARRENPGLPDLPEPLKHAAMLALWMEETRNDLEAPAAAVAPAITSIIVRLKKTAGCVAARMSGSGATVFGLYGAAAQAHQAAHDLRAAFPGYWVAAAPVITPE